ncbi:hypothetical protein [Wenyingzhuangia sp. IMCC45574]
MKLLFVSLFFSLQLFANECDSLRKVRNIFQAGVNAKQLEEMILICKASKCDKITPYLAAATMKKAEFVWSPFDKLKYFKKGKNLLEGYIKEHPTSVEAKYIRWLTQTMAPKFLGYRANLKQDYTFIQQHITQSDIDKQYQNIILLHIKKIKNE